MNGSGRWHAEQAWLGHRGENVLIEVEAGRIKTISEGAPAPPDAVALQGWTIPGLANVHSHAFQRLLRGEIESGGGDFWEWRDQMYRFTEWRPADYFNHGRLVFREMLEAGITAVGEFHYLHGHSNELGEALIDAAREEGIRITLIDACYLRGAMDGRPLEAEQLTFSDGDADRWARRVDLLEEADGVRIAAAIHSVRAVDPESMRIVAAYARDRHVPLHIHLAEQPADGDVLLGVEVLVAQHDHLVLDQGGLQRPERGRVEALLEVEAMDFRAQPGPQALDLEGLAGAFVRRSFGDDVDVH